MFFMIFGCNKESTFILNKLESGQRRQRTDVFMKFANEFLRIKRLEGKKLLIGTNNCRKEEFSGHEGVGWVRGTGS